MFAHTNTGKLKKRVIFLNTHHKGRRSFLLPEPPTIAAWSSVAGKKEAEGPLGHCFDHTDTDSYFGQKTWEKAESQLQKLALELLLQKAALQPRSIDLVCSGDLLNQCISSSFSLRNTGLPAVGLYGACSTMAESLLVSSMAVGGGFAQRAVAMTSSHFASSERQYRFPLGYGGQRTPTAQWTVTGSGAALVTANGSGPKIEAATVGIVVDKGIKDANNMGAAMAPAAFETIRTHFDDLGRSPEDYDLIVTGDLGSLGKELAETMFQDAGIHMGNRYQDCGCMIFDPTTQDVHAGGSGCGCSAVVLCGYLLDQIATGKLKRLLFCGTGALLSPVSSQQGESVPGVCHAVAITGGN